MGQRDTKNHLKRVPGLTVSCQKHANLGAHLTAAKMEQTSGAWETAKHVVSIWQTTKVCVLIVSLVLMNITEQKTVEEPEGVSWGIIEVVASVAAVLRYQGSSQNCSRPCAPCCGSSSVSGNERSRNDTTRNVNWNRRLVLNGIILTQESSRT